MNEMSNILFTRWTPEDEEKEGRGLGRNHVRGKIRSYVGRTLTGRFVFESRDEDNPLEVELIAVAPREIHDVHDNPQMWEKKKYTFLNHA